jgi:hypothetical protein
MYCRLYLGVENEAYGGQIIFSGLMNGFALTMLLWVYFFTATHEVEESQLRALLATVTSSATEPVSGSDATTEPEF